MAFGLCKGDWFPCMSIFQTFVSELLKKPTYRFLAFNMHSYCLYWHKGEYKGYYISILKDLRYMESMNMHV